LGVACLAACRKISFDRRKLGAFEFRTKREGFANTRAVGCEALASLSQPMPIILLLALEMRERMLEARDGAERRDGPAAAAFLSLFLSSYFLRSRGRACGTGSCCLPSLAPPI
jgi:hypothetical protein